MQWNRPTNHTMMLTFLATLLYYIFVLFGYIDYYVTIRYHLHIKLLPKY